MHINQITYRELKNTGNYENITIEMSATVDQDDDLDLCVEKLKRKVKRALKEA